LVVNYARKSRVPGFSGLTANRSPYQLLPQASWAAPVAFRLLGAKRTLRYGYGSCPQNLLNSVSRHARLQNTHDLRPKTKKNNTQNPPEEPHKHISLASFQCHYFLTAEQPFGEFVAMAMI
jgi:hypothetical protein